MTNTAKIKKYVVGKHPILKTWSCGKVEGIAIKSFVKSSDIPNVLL
jgi:hypothetical protein